MLLCSCKSPRTIVYRAYSPAMQELRFINDSICIYSYNDVFSGELDLVYHDSCSYSFFERKNVRGIIINRQNETDTKTRYSQNGDSLLQTYLDFDYEVNPIENMISMDNYIYEDEVYPLFSPPGLFGGTFYEQFGTKYHLVNDTIFIFWNSLVWIDRPLKKYSIFITDSRNNSRWARGQNDKSFYNWVTKSYEYLNYHTNYGKITKVKKEYLYNTTFTFLNDSSIKETMTFLNDSMCVYSSLTRTDTCRYTIKNHLLILDGGVFRHDQIAYSNGILFYSKVYKNSMVSNLYDTSKMKLIIKPYINEQLSWGNQDDSIKAIMEAYYNVYVPINFYR